MLAFIGSRTTRERKARGEGITICRVGIDGLLRSSSAWRCPASRGRTGSSSLSRNRTSTPSIRPAGLSSCPTRAWTASSCSVSTPAELPFVQTREGAGPRNVVFDATGRHVYASNRVCDTIETFSIDAATGRLAHRGSRATEGRTLGSLHTGSPVCMVFGR